MVVATLASLRSRYRKHMGMRLVTPEERKDIHRQFVEIDADGSGALDRDELRAALQKLGFRSISQRAFEDLFAEADLDGNGSIDEEEFVTLLMRHKLDGQLSFAECASQVLSRDFGHLRRNWKDEVGQQLGLGAIMVLFLVVIYSLARLASSLQEKAGRDL
ncbi:hypothetical protein T484DRAFT_3102924 [Baffinella frigidus]|nr:hypothetical protein T484DRAFT_3102924 [Cryptophyta sp. CCMP2293]